MNHNGLLIAIEGVDGVGKSTQVEDLRQSLVSEGYDTVVVSFPRYNHNSSYFVREFLKGNYGEINDISPYNRALFYALDRYDASQQIREHLKANRVVICDRYAGSNMAFQGASFARAEERRGFFIWLDNLEYQLLNIPRPQLSIVLSASPELVSQRLANKNDSSSHIKQDAFESNSAHLEKVSEVFHDLVQLFPNDFVQIDCERNSAVLSKAVVARLIRDKVEPLLPSHSDSPVKRFHPRLKQSFNFTTPASLSDDVAEQYQQKMSVLNDAYQQVSHKLNAYLATHPEDYIEAEEALECLVPIAGSKYKIPAPHVDIGQGIGGQLPNMLAAETKAIQLIETSPRNELELVTTALYPLTNQPQKTIQEIVSSWSYEQKSQVLTNPTIANRLMTSVSYSWDLVTSLLTQEAISNQNSLAIKSQMLTPRYGYEVPAIIDQAEATDIFEACFDLSLALYSHLQASGFEYEAQNTVLMGHKSRWSLSCDLASLKRLKSTTRRASASNLLDNLWDSASSVHPILTNTTVT